MGNVTIKDIALKAGISKTAVSFAFNNPTRLSETTLRHILTIAEEMGYSPNPVARSMTTGRTGAIGLLVPQPIDEIIRNPHFPEFIEGIGDVCTRSGLSLMLVPPLKGSMRRAIDNAAVDGIITLGLEEDKATMVVVRQYRVPFVTVDSDPIEGVPAINVDDAGGACQAMQHILNLGHRHIAILAIRSGKQGHYKDYVGTLGARMNGYLKALGLVGLSINGRSVRLIECVSTEAGGEEGFRTLWKSRNKPTAVVAMSDIIAIGVIKAAAAQGLRVPEDLSVLGFDNITLASLIKPALTTVSQPSIEKGRQAASLLVSLLDSPVPPTHTILPTQLILRQSVAAPRPDD
jgi:DNA-binding LacI/PurR family transcriptional regulator